MPVDGRTLQDFYAHTNYVELQAAQPDFDRSKLPLERRLGRQILHWSGQGLGRDIAGPAEVTCRHVPWVLSDSGLTKLTSGYYPNDHPPISEQHKCRHGQPRAVYRFKRLLCFLPFVTCDREEMNGLNKDSSQQRNHGLAHAFAVAATIDFVEQILDDPRIRENPRALQALYDDDLYEALVSLATFLAGVVFDRGKDWAHQILGWLIDWTRGQFSRLPGLNPLAITRTVAIVIEPSGRGSLYFSVRGLSLQLPDRPNPIGLNCDGGDWQATSRHLLWERRVTHDWLSCGRLLAG